MNLNQIEFKVSDTYKKVETKTKNFEAIVDENIMSTGFLDTKLNKVRVINCIYKKNIRHKDLERFNEEVFLRKR